jgi:hypothetical protein
MGCFTKQPAVADVLVTNFLCHFRAPMKTPAGSVMAPQSLQDAHHPSAFTEHLRKVVSMHQRNWGESLPLFLLVYRASTHKTTGMLPPTWCPGGSYIYPVTCCLERPQTKSNLRPTAWQTLWISHHYACQQLKVASDRMKTHYDHLATAAGLQEVDFKNFTNSCYFHTTTVYPIF